MHAEERIEIEMSCALTSNHFVSDLDYDSLFEMIDLLLSPHFLVQLLPIVAVYLLCARSAAGRLVVMFVFLFARRYLLHLGTFCICSSIGRSVGPFGVTFSS